VFSGAGKHMLVIVSCVSRIHPLRYSCHVSCAVACKCASAEAFRATSEDVLWQ